MSNIATKLSTLNVLRAAAGKAPLAGWKNSEADLDQRIKDLTPAQNLVDRIPQDPDRTAVLEAMQKAQDDNTTVTTTVLPADPILAKPARRKAIIEQMANVSVAKDEPTTVIDAKKAGRQLNKAAKTTTKKITAKNGKDVKVTTKTTKVSTPKSDNKVGALFTELGLDPKKSRAKLRANGINLSKDKNVDLAEVRRILTTDGRKKAK